MIERLLASRWGLADARVEVLGGGMNSETWLVTHRGTTYVAKRVRADQLDELARGCTAAVRLADAGLVTGRPVPTHDGDLADTATATALLEHVPGMELEGETDEEQRGMAEVMARVHVAGDPVRDPGRPRGTRAFFDWLTPRAPGVDAHPWLGPAVVAVRAETDGLDLTWSLLHTDPAPEAFVHDPATGTTGLIDWTGSCRGPVLYDVASAVMYLGGPEHAGPFERAYATHGPLGPDELVHLDALRRYRWVVQAAYFAGRVLVDDRTGDTSPADNQRGLDHAREGLAELGVPVGGGAGGPRRSKAPKIGGGQPADG